MEIRHVWREATSSANACIASASLRVTHVDRAGHSADQTPEAVQNEIHIVSSSDAWTGEPRGALRNQRIRQVPEISQKAPMPSYFRLGSAGRLGVLPGFLLELGLAPRATEVVRPSLVR